MSRIDEFSASWLSHRNALIELLEVIDNGQLHFKPWEGAMSLSELVIHLSGAMEMFILTVKNGEFTQPTEGQEINSIVDLRNSLITSTEKSLADLKSLSYEQLEKEVEFNGTNMLGIVLLESGKEHEIHHKGQLFTYARLSGAENLPFFNSKKPF